MSKHTEGPWVYESGAVYHAEKGRLAVMDRDNDKTAPTERDANARLMAAAPALLGALQEINRRVAAWAKADNEAGAIKHIIDQALRMSGVEA